MCNFASDSSVTDGEKKIITLTPGMVRDWDILGLYSSQLSRTDNIFCYVQILYGAVGFSPFRSKMDETTTAEHL
jgi:hypothetical protein